MTQGRTAADALVESLVAQGVTRVFCVPGESYLAVLDALGRSGKIEVVACRHEAGAANMAEAHAKLTGQVGVCMVTRGPGATHASVGVHTASQDSTPLIVFIGQVARSDRGREAFQEVDYRAFFGPLTKWADEIDDPARMDEYVSRAFSVATAGRMGPVALALPEDMLHEPSPAGPSPRAAAAAAALSADSADAVAEFLNASKKPLLVLGGSGWTREARANIRAFIEANDVPVVLSFRRKDILGNDHPNFVGDLGLGPNPKLIERVKAADLILAIGARLGENPTQGYTLFTREETAQKLVHIHADAQELNRVWPARWAGVATVAEAARSLRDVSISSAWQTWRQSARADYEAWTKPIAVTGAVNMSEIVAHLNEALPADAIICNGAGNYAAWLHRFILHREGGRQLAPTSGAMGYGVPAAIAAKLAEPHRDVIALAGDGCFLMTGQELATAVQYDAKVVIIVVDNGSYGTIRMHQEKHYPGRVVATDLRNPDFAAFAASFGAWSTKVERTEDFPAAFENARKAGKPALIHLITSVEDIAPGRTIASVRGT